MVTLLQSLYTLSILTGERVSDRVAALQEERGASAVEYALLVGLIAVVIVGAIAAFGSKLSGMFNDLSFTPAKS